MAKRARSAVTGHFVKAVTAARHPKTTIVETTGGKSWGNRSAITGRFVKGATARRHPDTTVRHGG